MSEGGSNGRFAKGTSGNTKGRPKTKIRRFGTMEDMDNAIIDVLNYPTTIKTSEGSKTLTLGEANILSLGTGTASNRLAAKHLIDLGQGALRRSDLRAERARKKAEFARKIEERDRQLADIGL